MLDRTAFIAIGLGLAMVFALLLYGALQGHESDMADKPSGSYYSLINPAALPLFIRYETNAAHSPNMKQRIGLVHICNSLKSL